MQAITSGGFEARQITKDEMRAALNITNLDLKFVIIEWTAGEKAMTTAQLRRRNRGMIQHTTMKG
jgi:hypothetical protein